MPITQRQRKILKDRLLAARHEKPFRWHSEVSEKEFPKPASVKAAELRIQVDSKIVHRFEDRRKEFGKKRQEKVNLAMRECERLIEFENDPVAAIKAVEAFEAKKF